MKEKITLFDIITISLFMISIPICFVIGFVYWITYMPVFRTISLISFNIGILNLVLMAVKAYGTRDN